MKLSQHYISVPESPLRKLAPKASAAIKSGKKVYALNIGQPDFELTKSIHEMLSSANINGYDKYLPYAPSEGIAGLRSAWTGFFQKNNISFGADQIIVTEGASEAITFALAAVAGPDDEVLTFQPCYANYISFASQTGTHLVPIPTFVEDGFHFHEKKKIIGRLTPRTRAILLSNPGNPTGTVFTNKELQAIVDVAVEYDLYIIADEVYREIVFDNLKSKSMANFPEIDDRLILVDSVSKRFSACGMRVGCMATKNKEIYELILRYAQARLSVATLEQIMAAELLTNTDIGNIVEAYESRRNIFVSEIQKNPAIKFQNPEGAIYLLLSLPVDDAEEFASWMLDEFDDDGETVFVAPAKGFYLTPGYGQSEIRISLVLPEDDLRRAAEILGKGIEAYNTR